LAHSLTKAGAQVIISARRVNQLEEVANLCAEVGKKPYVLPMDITNEEEQKLAYDDIMQKFGVIDSLVLNAGRSQRAAAMDTSIKDTRDLFDLNVFSFISLSKVVIPSMIERRAGQIVVVSSVSGKIGVAGLSSYASTKFALVSQDSSRCLILMLTVSQHGYFDSLRQEIGRLRSVALND
jgi:dehydrogenase/reductase SDR family member 7B